MICVAATALKTGSKCAFITHKLRFLPGASASPYESASRLLAALCLRRLFLPGKTASITFFNSLLARAKHHINGTYLTFPPVFQFHFLSSLKRFQNVSVRFQVDNRLTVEPKQNITRP